MTILWAKPVDQAAQIAYHSYGGLQVKKTSMLLLSLEMQGAYVSAARPSLPK
jgi:hypothetical protein